MKGSGVRLLVIILLLELIALVLRFFWALRRCIFLRRVEKKWLQYQRKPSKEFSDPLVQWLEGKSVFVKRYFKEAELQEPNLGYVEPAGYGYVQKGTASAWENWLKPDNEVESLFLSSLYKAIGYYRHVCIETILPWFWLEFIIFFPREFSKFLGVPTKYWGAGLVDFIYKAGVTGLLIWSILSK